MLGCLQHLQMELGYTWALHLRVSQLGLPQVLQTVSLEQQKLTTSPFWRLEVQDQSVSRVGVSCGLSLWFVDGHLLPES